MAELAKTQQVSLSAAAPPLMELRLEGSDAAVCFSEPCPCCGNRKRRCLHPPTRSRKKLLVSDPLPTSPSPVPPLAASSAILRRSDSSPLPSSPASAAVLRRTFSSGGYASASLTPSPPRPASSPFLRSFSLPVERSASSSPLFFPPSIPESTVKVSQPAPVLHPSVLESTMKISPPAPVLSPSILESTSKMSPPATVFPSSVLESTAKISQADASFVFCCSDPIPPMSPPGFLAQDRRSARSVSSASTGSDLDKEVTCVAEEMKLKERVWEDRREGCMTRVSLWCGCGTCQDVVFLR